MRFSASLIGMAGLCLAVASAGMQRSAPPQLPDPRLTPGAVLNVNRDDVCRASYSKKVRNVPASVQRRIYREYGITHPSSGEYEIDHLISAELGGANSLKNLWPQSYHTQPWNAHVKDALESELRREVCAGQLDLSVAQHDLAHDWIAAYKKYFHTDRPLSNAARQRRIQQIKRIPNMAPHAVITPVYANRGQVWVDTATGTYWGPGSKYYGKTRKGRFMSKAQAIKAGYHAAGAGKRRH